MSVVYETFGTQTDSNITTSRSLSTDKHVDEPTSAPNFRQPLVDIPKLPPQQTLMPQENPFDIRSDLIPHQEKEVEPIFKTPVLDDFLLITPLCLVIKSLTQH